MVHPLPEWLPARLRVLAQLASLRLAWLPAWPQALRLALRLVSLSAWQQVLLLAWLPVSQRPALALRVWQLALLLAWQRLVSRQRASRLLAWLLLVSRLALLGPLLQPVLLVQLWQRPVSRQP